MNPVMIAKKSTGEIWRASSGKVGWKLPAHAKNAWKASFSPQVPEHLTRKASWGGTEVVKFNDQDEYEIIFIDRVLKELYELRANSREE